MSVDRYGPVGKLDARIFQVPSRIPSGLRPSAFRTAFASTVFSAPIVFEDDAPNVFLFVRRAEFSSS